MDSLLTTGVADVDHVFQVRATLALIFTHVPKEIRSSPSPSPNFLPLDLVPGPTPI